MANFNRQTIIATSGNLPLRSAGEKVIIDDTSKDVFNLRAGEFIVYDPVSNLTLDASDIPTAKNIAVGVGVGNPGEQATGIMHIGGDQYDLTKSEICSTVTTPNCAIPQVVDVFFKVNKCDDGYTISVNLDDARVRSEYNFNGTADYTFTVPSSCDGCDNCDELGDCSDVACKFVDLINGETQTDPSKITYFPKADLTNQYQPFRAMRIFNEADSRKIFCLNPDDTTCQDCAHLPAITGMKVDGTTYNFTYTTTPDGSQTLHSQVERVVTEMNKVLEDLGGKAHISKGNRPCCPYTITTNSCAAEVGDIVLIVDGSDVQPCETLNPFTPKIIESACKGCGVTDNSITFTCGFSLLVDVLELEDDSCEFPPNLPVPSYYGRTVDVQFAGHGWDCADFFINESQPQELPEGLGYFYADKAHYENHNGGSGRDWRNSNRRVGRIGLPDRYSRASNASNFIKSKETYCVYNILANSNANNKFNNQSRFYNTDYSVLLVPERDTQTKTGIHSVLQALTDRGLVCEDATITCGVTILEASLAPATASIAIAGTQQLTATVEPSEAAQTGTWASSDEAVATVDASGLVTGVAAGTATITFTATDGTTTATSVITVTA